MEHAIADIEPQVLDELVVANRVLFAEGVVDGFGHVSLRHPDRPDRFLLARNRAPALVTASDILLFDLDGQAVDAAGTPVYLERFIHSEIYRARADVAAVVHSHSPAMIPLGAVPGVTLQPISHMAGFIAGSVAHFEIRDAIGPGSNMLITDGSRGRALASTLGDNAVVLMRGHGSTVVGTTLREAVFRAIYAEANARLQLDAMRLGDPTFLDSAEGSAAAEANRGCIDRAWELWSLRASGHLR